jgi:hypothetical protein
MTRVSSAESSKSGQTFCGPRTADQRTRSMPPAAGIPGSPNVSSIADILFARSSTACLKQAICALNIRSSASRAPLGTPTGVAGLFGAHLGLRVVEVIVSRLPAVNCIRRFEYRHLGSNGQIGQQFLPQWPKPSSRLMHQKPVNYPERPCPLTGYPQLGFHRPPRVERRVASRSPFAEAQRGLLTSIAYSPPLLPGHLAGGIVRVAPECDAGVPRSAPG